VKSRLIFMMLFVFMRADILSDYKNGNYNLVCKLNNIEKFKKSENLLSIIGISCVKSDKLYVLPYLLNKLKHTKAGRKNSIYFTIIYLQKRLIYSYLFDNLSLKGFDLPDTDYILSHIFVKLKDNDFKRVDDKIIINYKNKVIKVYKVVDKFFVEEYENNKLIKRQWYR